MQTQQTDGGVKFIHDAKCLVIDSPLESAKQVCHRRKIRSPGKLSENQISLGALDGQVPKMAALPVAELEQLFGLQLHA